jgi:hypothetical protein
MLRTEIFPKKHDWMLSAFAYLCAVLLGFLMIPHWRMSCIMFTLAGANFTHVEKRFRERPLAATLVIPVAIVLTLCCFLTGVNEESMVFRAIAGAWLVLLAMQLAATLRAVKRNKSSNKALQSDR